MWRSIPTKLMTRALSTDLSLWGSFLQRNRVITCSKESKDWYKSFKQQEAKPILVGQHDLKDLVDSSDDPSLLFGFLKDARLFAVRGERGLIEKIDYGPQPRPVPGQYFHYVAASFPEIHGEGGDEEYNCGISYVCVDHKGILKDYKVEIGKSKTTIEGKLLAMKIGYSHALSTWDSKHPILLKSDSKTSVDWVSKDNYCIISPNHQARYLDLIGEIKTMLNPLGILPEFIYAERNELADIAACCVRLNYPDLMIKYILNEHIKASSNSYFLKATQNKEHKVIKYFES